jgi:hypothetical protein
VLTTFSEDQNCKIPNTDERELGAQMSTLPERKEPATLYHRDSSCITVAGHAKAQSGESPAAVMDRELGEASRSA